jgi:hypothetical protein
MTKHPSGDSFHKAAMAGDVKLFVSERIHEAVEALSQDIAAYQSDCSELAGRADHSIADAGSISDLACAELEAEATIQAATISAQNVAAEKTDSELRAFQYEHGITRAPIEADRTLAFMLLLLFLFIEGAINTVFFYGAGFAPGIAPAAALGFTIAGVTTLLSAGLGGGFFGRYWNYGVRAPSETPDMRKARRVGRFGSLLTGMALVLVLCVAALVRSTGQPESLSVSWDVLRAALSNMHSIMLMLSGTAFAILSWRTALSAFEDPYPSFSRASTASSQGAADRKAASDAALDALKAIHADAMDQLTQAANAVADIRHEPDKDFEALSDDYHRLHGLIDEREAVIRTQAAAFLQAQHVIAKSSSDLSPETISLDVLRSRIELPERPVFDDLGQFRTEHKAAVNALTASYTQALHRLGLHDQKPSTSASSSQA